MRPRVLRGTVALPLDEPDDAARAHPRPDRGLSRRRAFRHASRGSLGRLGPSFACLTPREPPTGQPSAGFPGNRPREMVRLRSPVRPLVPGRGVEAATLAVRLAPRAVPLRGDRRPDPVLPDLAEGHGEPPLLGIAIG